MLLPFGGCVLPIPAPTTVSVLSTVEAESTVTTPAGPIASPHVSRCNIWTTFVLIALSKTPCVAK